MGGKQRVSRYSHVTVLSPLSHDSCLTFSLGKIIGNNDLSVSSTLTI